MSCCYSMRMQTCCVPPTRVVIFLFVVDLPECFFKSLFLFMQIGPDGQPIDENATPPDGADPGKGPQSPEEQKKHMEEHKERAESFVLARKLRLAWAGVARKAHAIAHEDETLTPYQVQYLGLSAKAMEVSEKPWFVNSLTATILAAGATVGIQTELAKPGENEPQPALDTIDNIILAIFTIEVWLFMPFLWSYCMHESLTAPRYSFQVEHHYFLSSCEWRLSIFGLFFSFHLSFGNSADFLSLVLLPVDRRQSTG